MKGSLFVKVSMYMIFTIACSKHSTPSLPLCGCDAPTLDSIAKDTGMLVYDIQNAAYQITSSTYYVYSVCDTATSQFQSIVSRNREIGRTVAYSGYIKKFCGADTTFAGKVYKYNIKLSNIVDIPTVCGCNTSTIDTVSSFKGVLKYSTFTNAYEIKIGVPGLYTVYTICDSTLAQLQSITNNQHNESYNVTFSGDVKTFCYPDGVGSFYTNYNIKLTNISKR